MMKSKIRKMKCMSDLIIDVLDVFALVPAITIGEASMTTDVLDEFHGGLPVARDISGMVISKEAHKQPSIGRS